MPQLGGVLLAWDISKIKLKSPGYPPFKPEVIIKVSIVLIDEPTGWNVSPLCPWHWIKCWGFKGPVRAGA